MCTTAQARRAHAVVLQRMTKTTDPATRTSDLTQILTVRRWTLQAAIDERLPGGRTEHGSHYEPFCVLFSQRIGRGRFMGHVARLGTRSQRLAGRRCARRDTAMGLSPTTSRRGRG